MRNLLRPVALAAACCIVVGCLVEPHVLRKPFDESVKIGLDVQPAQTIAAPTAAPAPAESAVPVAAKEAIPAVIADEKPVALELRGAELGQAFTLIGAMAGINFVLDGDFSPTVAASFPAVKLQSALATLCEVHGCKIDHGPGSADVWRVTRPDRAAAQTRMFELENSTAAALEPQLKTLLGGDAIVVANLAANVIHVTAPADRLAEAERFLRRVDQLDRQVLVECRIFEVSQGDMAKLGAKINAGDISIDDTTWTFLSSFFSSPVAPDLIATGAADHSALDGALEALAERLYLKVLSRPNLLSLNNKEAKLEVISQVPYVQATTSTTGSNSGTGSVTVQEVQFKDIGLKLTLTPAIQQDGYVALHVQQEVSEQTGTFLSVPIVDTRKLDNWFLVKDGDTLRIGGILKDRQQHTVRGIPGLMDLPWIGRVFRFESDDQDQIDLEILLTPRLLSGSTTVPAGAEASARVELPAGS